MSVVIHTIERLIASFNRLRLWRSECRVWGMRFRSMTFDRWFYLRLHQLGLMGREEGVVLRRHVHPGMTVVDVGANLGLYTLLLARLVGPTGRIFAFEPDPELCSLIRENCTRNAQSNIIVYNLALGAQSARRTLHRFALNSGDNTLGGEDGRFCRHEVPVEIATGDTVLVDVRPDLIKIDVQGWELEVLTGMGDLLRANPQASLHLEIWPNGLRRAGASPEALEQWLRSRGYNLALAASGHLLDGPAFAAIVRTLTGVKHADILAFHGSTQ